ncbi:MAG: hypothetical protein GXO69_01100 [Acidobacteria bacterium]|nr:hypothetical protein [Acidobacteriota bacterium]
MRKYILVILLLMNIGNFNSFAGEMPPLLKQALSNMNKTDYAKCAYILTTTTESKKTIEEHDPFLKQPFKWKLLKINGKSPSKTEILEYRKQKLKELKKGENKKGRLNLQVMFKKGTVKFLKEENGRITYSFSPAADSKDEKKIMPHVFGEVCVIKDKPAIESIVLKSRKPFSPTFSFKINKFILAMFFKPFKGRHCYLLNSVTTEIEGKVMGIKKISQKTSAEYSNYEFSPKQKQPSSGTGRQ